LRAKKMSAAKRGAAEAAAAMTALLADDALALVEHAARRVLAACAAGDELTTQLAILRRLARATPANTVELSRAVARQAIALERYPV
jgi:hypothetical protein